MLDGGEALDVPVESVLFTFTARVSAYTLRGPAPDSGETSGSEAETGGSTSGSDEISGLTGNLLQFTVNPLTKKVSVTLLKL